MRVCIAPAKKSTISILSPIDSNCNALEKALNPDLVAEYIVSFGEGYFDAKVDVLEYLGSDTFLVANAENFGSITVRCLGETQMRSGLKVGLDLNLDKIYFFDEDGQSI